MPFAEITPEQIDQLRESKAAWLPVEGAAPVEGNMVRVDVAAVEDGERKPPQPYTVVIGQGQTLPAIEEGLLSLEPGQSREVSIRFPDDHPDESRRGQSRQVHLTLHEVKRQELPPLDDGFAQSVGDFDDLTALTAAVRRDLAEIAAFVRERMVQKFD